MRVVIESADVLQALKEIPDASFDALLCDPPYGLGNKKPTRAELVAYLQGADLDTGGDFMGNAWSVPSVAVWNEIFRVLKPGAPLLVCSGTRTQDLISFGMRAAGFEICDVIDWIYGSGMPKPATTTDKYIDKALGSVRPVIGSQVLSGSAALSLEEKGGTYAAGTTSNGATKTIALTGPGSPEAEEWEGYGHALTPAREPIILACKPFDGTIAHNVLTHGTGALNVKGCRIATDEDCSRKPSVVRDTPAGIGKGLAMGGKGDPGGRWPKNVIFDEAAGAELDAIVGDRPSTLTGRADPKATHANPGDNGDASWFGAGRSNVYADGGGPSRFFYCTKVSKKEREAGCESLPLRSAAEVTKRKEGSAGSDRPQAGAGRGSGARNHHPTLKPLALTEYLAKLILQPSDGAALLIPYSGAGSEIIGALKAGWKYVYGVERDPQFVEIAKHRIAHHTVGAEIVT